MIILAVSDENNKMFLNKLNTITVYFDHIYEHDCYTTHKFLFSNP